MQSPSGMHQAQTDYYRVEPANLGPAPRCAYCGRLRGLMVWLPPHRAEIEVWGNTWSDMCFGGGDELLVSSRFRQWYERSGLRGVDGFYPVQITGTRRHGTSHGTPPEYHVVTVSASGAAIDQAASGLERKDGQRDKLPICPHCREGGLIQRIRRVVLEPDSWSGEDLFRPRGLSGTYIATSRFQQLATDSGICGVAFVPTEDYQFDFYPTRASN